MGDEKQRNFEECINEINVELEKRRRKWTLSAVPSMDFDDVCQIIKLHLWKKWYLYDQSRPLVTWLNTVITHQIKNLLRNNYSRFTKPCLRCACNEGGDLCSLYGTQNIECQLYNNWIKNKKIAYDINLPVSIENHAQEVFEVSDNKIDIDKSVLLVHKKMQEVLKPIEWKVYKSIYIDNKSEEDTAKLMGYKSVQEGKFKGYRQLKNVQKTILNKVKKCLKNSEIDI